jgi:Tfp pilus assembly protein PilX
MKHIKRNSRQRGAALIIGLILLAVITLLAVVGLNISNSELASANSEQIRVRAFQAAETGIEHGLLRLLPRPPDGKKRFDWVAQGDTTTYDPEPVTGSPEDIDGNAIDTYTNTLTYRGDGSAPGYSTKFSAFNFSILSEGKSVRDTTIRNELGAYRVNNDMHQDFDALPE